METLGNRVFRLRKAKGWSQARLAEEVRRHNPKLKTTQSTIYSIESSESEKPTILYELAAALGVNQVWLKTGTGEPDAPAAGDAIDTTELFDHVFAVVAGSYEGLGLSPEEAASLAQTVREVAEEPLSPAEAENAQVRRRTLGEFFARKFLKTKPARFSRA